MNTKLSNGQRVGLVLALVSLAAFAIVAAGPGLLMPARASTANATVTWNIPQDKTISLSYPANTTEIYFHPSSATFAQLWAHGQGNGSTPAVIITNDGNVAVGISAVFTTTLTVGNAGLAEFRLANASSTGNPSTGQIWWCGAATDTGQVPAGSCSGSDNSTTSRQIIAAAGLSSAGTKQLWAWSWGTNVAGGYTKAILQFTSA